VTVGYTKNLHIFSLLILQENNNFPRTPCQSLTDPHSPQEWISVRLWQVSLSTLFVNELRFDNRFFFY